MDQVSGSNLVDVGIDLTEFYLSVEWDILAVPATRNEEYYPCCEEPYSGQPRFYSVWVGEICTYILLRERVYLALLH